MVILQVHGGKSAALRVTELSPISCILARRRALSLFSWRSVDMRRREFVGLLGGAAAMWPLEAQAQRDARRRRIAIMPPGTENDPETKARLAAFRQGLEQLGWSEGRNVQFEYRWAQAEPELIKRYSAELVASAPDLILTGLTPAVQALKRESTTIPILFANIADPVASGLVPSLAKPGGNVTGFTAVEYAIVGKWLELLKEFAPDTARVVLIGNPDIVFTKSFFGRFESVAPSFSVTPVIAEVRTSDDVERALLSLAREPNGGILVVPELTATIHRALIFRLAISNRLPTVFPFRFQAVDGALASYGPDQVEQYRGAARYADRILRGTKPSDLPVQAPTKFDFIINLKTAKALGLTVSPTLLARADAVIE
ncbi:MAG: ABC transporter substrate-binding protein [Hyphomicrobiales bacterium]|nr:ABC transporter substrate-binding protein [Hyphomicrobiales bacterium]